MSQFTDLLNKLFSRGGAGTQNMSLSVSSSQARTNDLTNEIKTDRSKARKIYHNTEKSYLLSGQLAKPIIKNNVNFVGEPELGGNKKVIKILEDINMKYAEVHKSAEIEGTVGVWPQWNAVKEEIEIILVPLSVISKVLIDPISKEIIGYRLEEQLMYNSPEKDNCVANIQTLVTKNKVEILVTGSMQKHTVARNFLGVVPITLFTTDKDSDEIFGHSELESVEPQLRFYHDLTFEAGSAQSRDGHPKLKISTDNPRQWIENNFGAGKYEEVLAGKSSLSLDDRDLYINSENDDVNYIYLNKTSGDYEKLAGTTFTNIVEGSQVPEINFGANIGTSLASVKEYRPIWIKNIEAKQRERGCQWKDVYQTCLDIYNFIHFRTIKLDIELTWPKPNFVSALEQATVVKSFSEAIDKMRLNGTLTDEEAYNTVVSLDIFDMTSSWEEHKEAIDAENKEKEAKAARLLAEEAANAAGTETDDSDKSGDKSGSAES